MSLASLFQNSNLNIWMDLKKSKYKKNISILLACYDASVKQCSLNNSKVWNM